MSRELLKQMIIDCMETADDSVLEAICILLNRHESAPYQLTEEQMKIVEETRADYRSGKGKSHDWDEVKHRIKAHR